MPGEHGTTGKHELQLPPIEDGDEAVLRVLLARYANKFADLDLAPGSVPREQLALDLGWLLGALSKYVRPR